VLQVHAPGHGAPGGVHCWQPPLHLTISTGQRNTMADFLQMALPRALEVRAGFAAAARLCGAHRGHTLVFSSKRRARDSERAPGRPSDSTHCRSPKALPEALIPLPWRPCAVVLWRLCGAAGGGGARGAAAERAPGHLVTSWAW